MLHSSVDWQPLSSFSHPTWHSTTTGAPQLSWLATIVLLLTPYLTLHHHWCSTAQLTGKHCPPSHTLPDTPPPLVLHSSVDRQQLSSFSHPTWHSTTTGASQLSWLATIVLLLTPYLTLHHHRCFTAQLTGNHCPPSHTLPDTPPPLVLHSSVDWQPLSSFSHPT